MGGHTGTTSRFILGRGKNTVKLKRGLQKKIGDASTVGVVTAAVEVIAMTNPAVAALYAAYKIAKFTYPIAKEGVKEYVKTGDKDKAIEKMGEKTQEQIVGEVKEKAVEHIVDKAWEATKASTGMKTTETTDKAVTSATSATINELIKND